LYLATSEATGAAGNAELSVRGTGLALGIAAFAKTTAEIETVTGQASQRADRSTRQVPTAERKPGSTGATAAQPGCARNRARFRSLHRSCGWFRVSFLDGHLSFLSRRGSWPSYRRGNDQTDEGSETTWP
jgi:hypothetical protein